jgi:mannose-6-phosphate isomerase-like protein (cupin superfamily)
MNEETSASLSDSEKSVRDILEQAGPPHFDSWASFNHYCRHLLDLWRSSYSPGMASGEQFMVHWEAIRANAPRTIRTPWGGVHVTITQLPNVEQYVVIEGGRYTPLEKHLERVETFLVRDGVGVLVYRPVSGGEIQADPISPGYSITLLPEQEHAIVALEDLLMYERVTDVKGEDEGRVIIFDALQQ